MHIFLIEGLGDLTVSLERVVHFNFGLIARAVEAIDLRPPSGRRSVTMKSSLRISVPSSFCPFAIVTVAVGWLPGRTHGRS